MKEMQAFFKKKYYPTLRENFIGKEEFKNQKSFRPQKNGGWRLFLENPQGLNLHVLNECP
jgi:hypothetical protein